MATGQLLDRIGPVFRWSDAHAAGLADPVLHRLVDPPEPLDWTVGSVATRRDHTGRDVDFLVDFEAGATLLDLAGLKDEFEEILGCSVDVLSSRGLKPRGPASLARHAGSGGRPGGHRRALSVGVG